MGTIYVDEIKHQSAQGSGTITIGASGETVAVASGSSLNVSGNASIGTTSDGVLTINGGASTSPQLIFNDAGTNRARIGVPTGQTYLSLSGSNSLTADMAIDSSGNVSVGTTTANAKFNLYGTGGGYAQTLFGGGWGGGIGAFASLTSANTNNADVIYFSTSAQNVGKIAITSTSTSYNTSSDYRLKNNISDVLNAIDRVKQLKPIRFNFIAEPNKIVDGFLAHEVQDVVPEAVTGTKDAMKTEKYEVTPAVLDEDGNVVTEAVMGTREVPDYQGIDQAKLVPLLTAGLQEAIAKIETLEARITALENA